MPRRIPGTDNRVLRVCRLLNRRRVKYLLAGGEKPITIVGDDPRVDILTIAWDVTFDQAYRARVVRRIAGIRVPHLGLRDLLRSKRTGRAQDLADIELLKGIAPPRPRRRRKQ